MQAHYKIKYLKYKTKYINLQKRISGGGSNNKNILTSDEENLKKDKLINKNDDYNRIEKEKEQKKLEIKQQNELKNAEQRRKIEEYAKIEEDAQLEIINNLKIKLENFKLKEEDCTAIFMKTNCKKAIGEFNNYIKTEIDFVINHVQSPISKQLLVIGHLNKLIDFVDKDKTKKIITEYKDKRSTVKFNTDPNLFFGMLDEIKKQILSL